MSDETQPDSLDILRQTSACMVVADAEGIIHFCNPATEELLSISERQLKGTQIGDLFLDGDMSPQRIFDALHSSHTTYQRDARLLLISREWINADISISPFQSNEQEFLLIELHARDRQHHIGMDSNEYSQHLAANALIRGLGHEIKNPLGGLRGAAQLLAMELSDSDLNEYTEVIIKESDRLSSLVDRMMTPNKPGLKAVANVHEPLENALKLVQIEAGEELEIKRNYDPSIPDFEMLQDGLEQAFLNLAQNAAQAMNNRGLLKVETRVVRQMLIGDKQQRLAVRINMMDSGPGVPDSLKERLFLPMVSGKANGTGLGLGVAQNLVQQHGGMIEYRDDLPETTFSVFLPLITTESV